MTKIPFQGKFYLVPRAYASISLQLIVFIHYLAIFLHPSNLLFYFLVITSTILSIAANNWFLAWISLEINVLAFIPLLIKKKSKYQAEAAIKYFIIQVVASLMLIIVAAIIYFIRNIALSLIALALLIKIGAAPTHQWILRVAGTLSWNNIFIILVIQKIIPLSYLSLALKEFTTISTIFVVCRAIAGSLGGLIQRSLRKILAYSSIAHLGWIITRLILQRWLWIHYFIIYAIILSLIIFNIDKIKITYLTNFLSKSNSTLKVMVGIMFLGIAGLPPGTGFLLKIIVLRKSLTLNLPFITITLLISALTRLFFYLRAAISNMLNNPDHIIENKPPKKNIALIALNAIGLLVSATPLIYKF